MERAVHTWRDERWNKLDQNDCAVWFASLVADLTECDEVPVQVLVLGDNPVQVSVLALDDEKDPASAVLVPALHDEKDPASAVLVPALHDETVPAQAVSDERWEAEPDGSALDERWAEPDGLALDERWAEPDGSALDERWAELMDGLALGGRWDQDEILALERGNLVYSEQV